MNKPTIIHPFLFAVFPIAALFTYNARTIPVPIREIALPAVLSLASTLVLFVFFRLLTRNGERAGVLVSLFLFWFYSFGHVLGILNPGTAWILGETILYGSLIALAICFLFLIRSRKGFAGLTRLLNITSIALIAINLVFVIQILIRGGGDYFKKSGDIPATEAYPNIYFIVLDGYARADVLSELYHFDNAPLIDYLRQSGFYVASRSYANYCQTYLSLAATLNLSYLDELVAHRDPDSNDRRPLIRMIRNSRVMQLLKSRGYSLVSFESGYTGTEMRDADFFVQYPNSLSEFQNVLISTTPLILLLKAVPDMSPFALHRNRINGAFRRLSTFRSKKTPFFILAHIMAPHPPFVFNNKGEGIEPPGPYSIRDASHLHRNDAASIQSYIISYGEQLAAVNEKTKSTIAGILRTSPPPIIILQSDHGPKALTSWEDPAATCNKEALAILNAVYLPGKDYGNFYPEISPINSFILLMNRVLGMNMDLLEDKIYFSTWSHPYQFIPLDRRSLDLTIDPTKEIHKKLRSKE